MNNETILLLLWLGLTILYPMIKKGMQAIALDLTYLIMIPIGLIYRLWKILQYYMKKHLMK